MIAAEVSRLSKSVRDFATTVERIVDENEVVLHILDMGIHLDPNALFCRLAECVDGDTIDEAADWCPDEVQGPKKPVGPSGLVQALLGQAAELRQHGCNNDQRHST